jgi:ABC-type sugar transport system ATPase subunit
MTLADRIVCLDGGRIAQVGTPDELYNRPENLFVAGFIGSPAINLLTATVEGRTLRLADGQSLTLPETAPSFATPRSVTIGLRPEDLSDASRLGTSAAAQGLVMDYLLSETLGSDTYLIGDIAGQRVTARCAPDTRPAPGTKVPLFADAARLHLFDPETRKRL